MSIVSMNRFLSFNTVPQYVIDAMWKITIILSGFYSESNIAIGYDWGGISICYRYGIFDEMPNNLCFWILWNRNRPDEFVVDTSYCYRIHSIDEMVFLVRFYAEYEEYKASHVDINRKYLRSILNGNRMLDPVNTCNMSIEELTFSYRK